MLSLEIEFLTGVSVATGIAGRDADAEWPPHPDRVFQALVAAWGDGRDSSEQAALEWLEKLHKPCILASDYDRRAVATVYVPPNDYEVKGKVGSPLPKNASEVSLPVIPELRKKRRPRRFPAVIPHDPFVHIIWKDATAPNDVLIALKGLATRVAYIGHSHSMVRVCVSDQFSPHSNDDRARYRPIGEDQSGSGSRAIRVPYEGRLDRLKTDYEDGRRPGGYATISYTTDGEAKKRLRPSNAFSAEPRDWIVFQDDGGLCPEVTAFPHVAKAVRNCLMRACSDPAPPLVSGHDSDGKPTRDPHLGIIPLCDIGHRHASGRLMGFAIVFPSEESLRDRKEQVEAVRRGVAKFAQDMESRSNGNRKDLLLGKNGRWRIARVRELDKISLDPERYLGEAERWATVTPILLDRHPKTREGQDAESIVRAACRNVGLPEPVAVMLSKYSAVAGAPPAWPPGGAPNWTDWSFPEGSKRRARPLRHATITFGEPVEGPVVLGAGRFRGLGLCLPIRSHHGNRHD